MSTKTSFKRIALVAVAGLVSGLVSVTPAAAITYSPTTPFSVKLADSGVTGANATVSDVLAATQVAGVSNYVQIEAGDDTAAGSIVVVSVSGSNGYIKTTPAGWTDNASTGVRATVATSGSNAITGDLIDIGTPTAGSVTVTISTRVDNLNGSFTDTLRQTLTITVSSAALTNVYNAGKSTAYLNDEDDAGTLQTNTTFAAGITADATLSTTDERATVTVTQNDAAGNALTSGFKTVTAKITGGGLLGIALNTPTGDSISTSAAAVTNIYVFSNGTAAKASLAISVNGALVRTIPINFYGAVTTLTATVLTQYVAASAAPTSVVAVVATDANGIAVADTPTITPAAATTGTVSAGTCSPSDPTNATPELRPALCDLTTGATHGSAVLTIKAGAVTTVTTTATVNVSKSVAKTIALSVDKASYLPGAEATATLTLTDEDGKPVASGDYSTGLTAALASNLAITAALEFDGDVATSTPALIKVKDGKATVKFFVPATPGSVTLTGTLGTDAVTGSLASTKVTTTFVVAESAAFGTLTTLINSLIAKMNALSKLVAKIQKKVRA